MKNAIEIYSCRDRGREKISLLLGFMKVALRTFGCFYRHGHFRFRKVLFFRKIILATEFEIDLNGQYSGQ